MPPQLASTGFLAGLDGWVGRVASVVLASMTTATNSMSIALTMMYVFVVDSFFLVELFLFVVEFSFVSLYICSMYMSIICAPLSHVVLITGCE